MSVKTKFYSKANSGRTLDHRLIKETDEYWITDHGALAKSLWGIMTGPVEPPFEDQPTSYVPLIQGVPEEEVIGQMLDRIMDEYLNARMKFPSFHSAHEAYAVILEELEEVWEAIKKNQGTSLIKAELIQTAAMCLAALLELR